MTALVQHKVGETNANQATLPITVTATSAGNLMVVAACNTGTLTVSGVADNAAGGSSVYAQVAGAQFVGNANDLGDVWASLNVKGGVTQVTITFSAADTSIKDGWAMEVSGLSSPVVDVKNVANTQTGVGTTDTGASVTTTATDGFIIGVITTSGSVLGGNPAGGNEFTAGGDVQATTGNGAVSLISTTAAAHQPVWTDAGSAQTFGAATVAFKAGVVAVTPPQLGRNIYVMP